MYGFLAFIRIVLASIERMTHSRVPETPESPQSSASSLAHVAIVFLGIALLILVWRLSIH
jgi:hypothetical protein